MKTLKDKITSGWVPFLTTCLFAIHPTLQLYAHNVDEVVLNQLFLPISFAILVATLLYGFWYIIIRNGPKAGLASVLFLLPFWNFGTFYRALKSSFDVSDLLTMPIVALVFCIILYTIFRIKIEKISRDIITIVLVPISVLIALNVVKIISLVINEDHVVKTSVDVNLEPENFLSTKDAPDMYLIILDEFANFGTIKSEWNYDNSPFAEFLRNKGFFVAQNSEARYSQTDWNVPTLLNLDYPTGPIEKSAFINYIYNREEVKGSKEYAMLEKITKASRFKIWNSNSLVNYLKRIGYEIHVLEGVSQHYKAVNIENVDFHFAYQDVLEKSNQMIDAFHMQLIHNSVLFAVESNLGLDPSFTRHYAGTNYVFNYLMSKDQREETPKFVLAHVMCPHSPYVFDRQGNYKKPRKMKVSEKGVFVRQFGDENKDYLEQYIFVVDQVKKIISSLINEDSSLNPVIVIQSDHGPRPHHLFLKDKFEAFSIFNTVYFPDQDYGNLHDSIAPVNTLRVMLNKYFDEDFEMLDER